MSRALPENAGQLRGSGNGGSSSRKLEVRELLARGGASPFAGLRFAPYAQLLGTPRRKCPRCNKSRPFYCADCLELVVAPSDVPQVSLPLKTHIIHHHSEKRSKSTAIHACLLAPNDVALTDYPPVCLPAGLNPADTVLLFPSKDAKPLREFDVTRLRHLLVIDSTWQTAKKVLMSPELAKFPRVKLETFRTVFWRTQPHGASFLATIESIYFFFVEFDREYRRCLQLRQSGSTAAAAATEPSSEVQRVGGTAKESGEGGGGGRGGEGPVEQAGLAEESGGGGEGEEGPVEQAGLAEESVSGGMELLPSGKGSGYDGRFDNLLFFYAMNYDIVKGRV